jgi:hypothetical protein
MQGASASASAVLWVDSHRPQDLGDIAGQPSVIKCTCKHVYRTLAGVICSW